MGLVLGGGSFIGELGSEGICNGFRGLLRRGIGSGKRRHSDWRSGNGDRRFHGAIRYVWDAAWNYFRNSRPHVTKVEHGWRFPAASAYLSPTTAITLILKPAFLSPRIVPIHAPSFLSSAPIRKRLTTYLSPPVLPIGSSTRSLCRDWNCWLRVAERDLFSGDQMLLVIWCRQTIISRCETA